MCKFSVKAFIPVSSLANCFMEIVALRSILYVRAFNHPLSRLSHHIYSYPVGCYFVAVANDFTSAFCPWLMRSELR